MAREGASRASRLRGAGPLCGAARRQRCWRWRPRPRRPLRGHGGQRGIVDDPVRRRNTTDGDRLWRGEVVRAAWRRPAGDGHIGLTAARHVVVADGCDGCSVRRARRAKAAPIPRQITATAMAGASARHTGTPPRIRPVRRVRYAASVMVCPSARLAWVRAALTSGVLSWSAGIGARAAGATGPAASVRTPAKEEMVRTDRKAAPSRLVCAAASAGAQRAPADGSSPLRGNAHRSTGFTAARPPGG